MRGARAGLRRRVHDPILAPPSPPRPLYKPYLPLRAPACNCHGRRASRLGAPRPHQRLRRPAAGDPPRPPRPDRPPVAAAGGAAAGEGRRRRRRRRPRAGGASPAHEVAAVGAAARAGEGRPDGPPQPARVTHQAAQLRAGRRGGGGLERAGGAAGRGPRMVGAAAGGAVQRPGAGVRRRRRRELERRAFPVQGRAAASSHQTEHIHELEGSKVCVREGEEEGGGAVEASKEEVVQCRMLIIKQDDAGIN